MNKIEKHLLKTGAFDGLNKSPHRSLAARAYSGACSGILESLRTWNRECDDMERPYAWWRIPGRTYHGERITRLWILGSTWNLSAWPGYWTGHHKPSVLALDLLLRIFHSDPTREGVTETNWNCTRNGRPLQGRRDEIDYLITRGWLKRSHPYLDLTDAGVERAKEYQASLPERCDVCGSIDLDPQGGGCCENCARQYIAAVMDDDDGIECRICGEYECQCDEFDPGDEDNEWEDP